MNSNTHRNLIETIDHIALREQIVPTSSVARMGRSFVKQKVGALRDAVHRGSEELKRRFPRLSTYGYYENEEPRSSKEKKIYVKPKSEVKPKVKPKKPSIPMLGGY